MLTDYRRSLALINPAGYNRMVFRLSWSLFAGFLFLTACRDELKTKEKVQEAVIERLQAHSGLDLKELDVTTTDVAFDRNKATATVAFHPKGEVSVNSGMTMRYNLEERAGKWVVTGVNNSQGSALGAHPPLGKPSEGELPSGHPGLPSQQ